MYPSLIHPLTITIFFALSMILVPLNKRLREWLKYELAQCPHCTSARFALITILTLENVIA